MPIRLLVCTVSQAAQVRQTLDKLFNNKCELDDREYFKINLSDIKDTFLSDYETDILNYSIQINLRNKVASQHRSNTHEDDQSHEYIISTVSKDTNFNNFDDLFEKVYREKLEETTQNIFVSGGLDSTTLFELLKRKDIAFKPYCIRYKSKGITFNDYEIKNIPSDTIIIDFDILDFFDSGKFLDTAQKYHCVTPQFLPLLKVFESIDGPILETSSAPNGSIEDGNVMGDRLNSRYLAYRYALDLRNDGSIFNFFRSHIFIDQLSTDCYAHLNKEYGRDVSRGSHHDLPDSAVSWHKEETDIKAYLYQNIFGCLGTRSIKFTGFEALKTWYADKYIGNDPYLQVFDKHFRKPLLKRNLDMFKDLHIINILKEK